MNESNFSGETGSPEAGNPPDNVATADLVSRAALPFPVVGIGASAGGIEALRSFFSATSASSGMAYVVIQHLSPDHGSLMAEILRRHTSMPVHPIEDGLGVEANHVYVIRPGHTVTLAQGKLRLGEPVELRGHRRPVDDFFRSLAAEQREKAIAVVLSGMGTNGTAGAQAVKAGGGLCIAQDPDQAQSAGMPRSLIRAGYADQVLKAEDIPGLLLRFAQHPYLALDLESRAQAARELEQHRQELDEIIAIVCARTGHDFAHYKAPTVLRRIQRRMGLIGTPELSAYAAHLKENAPEIEALANDLMINVTGFFRDPEAWEALRMTVVRPLVEERPTNQPIRGWVAACASGEEAYTLAMLIAEEAARARKKFEVKIFATDTAEKSLALARAGVYPGGIEGALAPERLERFFDKDEHTYRIKKNLRDQVVFALQDVLRDPPFSRVDLVSCRNLLIYLEPEAQRRALALMHFALRDGGILLLGNAETLGHAGDLFEVVSKRWRIYRRTGPARRRFAYLSLVGARVPDVRAPARIPAPVTSTRPSATIAIQAALLEKFGPPTAVVDAEDRIVYFNGDAEPYLQHPSGEVTQKLLEMVRAPLRPAVRRALRQAAAEGRAVTVEQPPQDGSGAVRVTAEPLRANREADYFRVSFEQPSMARASPPEEAASAPVTAAAPLAASGDTALEEEAASLRRELQEAVEAFEASNEELKASNEEVTSINEELQSTNEELETGKEELQSTNEELSTVNTQLQTKIHELEALTNDLDNLLSSTDIAVVFLDSQLNVRRFTPAIHDLLTLLPTDIGRPLAHLAQKFTDCDLIADAGEVLAKLVPRESEVLSHSGRWYLRRTLPFRTEDDRIAGVVITFVDITARRQAVEAIAAAQMRLEAVIEQMPTAVLMAEAPTGTLVLANRRAAALFNQPHPVPFIGHHWATTYSAFRGFHADGRPYELQEWPLARALASAEMVLDEELDFVRANGSRGTVSMCTAPIHDSAGAMVAVVATFWDITERKAGEVALRESEERFRALVEGAHDYAIFMLDGEGRVASWNPGAERVTGFSAPEIVGKSVAMLFTPEDRAAGVPDQAMRLAEGSGRAAEERWYVRKDGSRLWAGGVMTPSRDANGKLKGFVKTMRDQSERKATDERLQQALQSAQQLRATAEGANRAKDEFISTVSHELRTPLNTIRLWSRMFVSGKVQGKEVIEGGRMIDRAALAQQQLIDDLLDVSRMVSGNLRLAMRSTDLASTVSSAIDAIRALADSRRISLEVSLSSEVGHVVVDPDRIQQVVWNLLANAVKFTPEGGHIAVSMRRVSETVEIEVSDSGMGIRRDFLPHIFDRFRQGDSGSSRRYAGLGLGLAIAKQLTESHGGTIRAQSEGEGCGATFTVYLPLERQDSSAEEHAPADDAGDAHALEQIEVLLVEDESMARQATMRTLERQGAHVRAADSAAGAREAFAIRRPDIIVADIGMPDEDGYALLTKIRLTEEAQHTARVPAVAVTALARSEDRERALAAGYDEHLPKPVDPERLARVLRELVPPPARS